MMFQRPIPLTAALASQVVKTVMPTHLRSKMLAQLPVEIRRRAMFSAGVSSADLLQKLDDAIVEVLKGNHTEDTARSLAHRLPEMLDHDELRTESRLRLIIETNVDLARGYGGYQQSQDVDVLDEFPAWELYRAEERKEPRDWPARWEEAGGEFYPGSADYPEGRMIALKDDSIWEEISAFGLPWAPFDYNSGMDLQDVDRDEAEELGLIKPGELVGLGPVDFNDGVQASPNARGGFLDALVNYYTDQGIGRWVHDNLVRLVNDFPGHEGRPGQIGGSLPRGESPIVVLSKDETASPSESGSGGAGEPAESLAGRAARAQIVAGARSGPSQEELIAAHERQTAALERLERTGVASVPRNPARLLGGGAEHEVELSADGLRVIKHTVPGKFGVTLDGIKAPFGSYSELREGTPEEYVRRLDAANKVFGDDMRVEGVSRTAGGVSLVTSQRFITGEAPTQKQIDGFLAKAGFARVPGKNVGSDYLADKTWYHAQSGYLVADTKPDNFVRSKDGLLHPIDVIVQHVPKGSPLHRALLGETS